MRFDRTLLSLLPLVVGAVSLAITAWLWRHEQAITQRTLKTEFDLGVRQTASRIEQRMASYEQMLRGVQGLFLASGAVARADFDRYVDALLAGADMAGIQYFAYAPLISSAGGAQSAPLGYVAPATGLNLQALGGDPYADRARRAAMQLARDSSGLAITEKLSGLVGAERVAQPSFLMVLPVYAQRKATDNQVARRAAIDGWVLAGVRMADFMSSLYGEGTPGIEVRIYDGVELNRQTLMYESVASLAESPPPRFRALEYIGFAGHTWTIDVSARPAFEQRYSADASSIIVIAGGGLSLLLVLLTRQLVTARQRAHAAARSMTVELGASEERYRRIVETADEGILVTDAQARTSFANPKMARMLGQTVDALLGRPLAEFLDPDGPPAAVGRIARDTSDGPEAGELKLRRQDGSILWVSMRATPLFDPGGRRSGSLAMVTDITAAKQADATRIELEAQLRESQKMQAIGTLAGGIAHDFNNILAAILGHVALALQPGLDPATRASLEQIGRSAARARSLVQQILAFSRRQPHSLVSQPLQPVIEESLRLLRPILPAQVEVDVALAGTPLNVLADATQLHQVLLNLCTNAWHALNGESGRIGIGLEAVSLDGEAAQRLALPAGRHAHLWVSDNGCGMDEATRVRAFEPFFTTKPVGGGTGLGLSVVHGIVASHHGAITVSSQPGQGSRFDLYFALHAAHDERVPAVPQVPAAQRTGDRRVLYVDDDPVMVALVRQLLLRSGYLVTTFEDSRQAMAALRSQPDAFDLVVTDQNMPELSGLDIAEALARLRPDLPVVITTGFVSEEVQLAADRACVRRVMQKEYTLEQLPGILHQLLAEPRPVEGA